MPRVLVVGLSVLNPYLGPSTVTHNILKGFLKVEEDLVKNDLKVDFLSIGDGESRVFSEHIGVIGIKMHRPVILTSRFQIFLRKLGRKFDLIHSHVIYLSKFLQKSDVLFNLHGVPWAERKYYGGLYKARLYLFERLLRLHFPGFARVIVPSNFCLNELSRENFDVSKVTVIENPVSDEFLKVRKGEEAMILYPAVLRPIKNQHGFLRALTLVKEDLRGYDIIFAGGEEGDYANTLRKFAKNTGLSNVKFIGRVPYNQMVELYARASIVALTSFIESSPMAAIEAMATGTPLLASKVGGIPYLVEEGKTGLLVDPNDPKGIAEKLLILANDEVLRRRIGGNARAEAERRWRADIKARQLLNLYLEVLEGS